MRIEDFITELFCRIDDVLQDVPKHSQAKLYPSEVVTIALLFALKGGAGRAFYRWMNHNRRSLFPNLPDRTRLFRLFVTHQYLTDRFMADPTVLGVIDSYGIELIHPVREGRSKKQIGKKGKSNSRWIVGAKLCLLINQFGLVVDWDFGTANQYDADFQHLVWRVVEEMIVLADTHFHAAAGDPPNLKICTRGSWNVRMIIETVLSMLTTICHFKKVFHRTWAQFKARLAFTMAIFNILVQWDGLLPDDDGFVPLSIAQFSL
jgi:hypothetical protein